MTWEPTVHEEIVAVALVTQRELERFGPGFDRAFPIEDAGMFDDVLLAIDRADQEFRKRQQACGEHLP